MVRSGRGLRRRRRAGFTGRSRALTNRGEARRPSPQSGGRPLFVLFAASDHSQAWDGRPPPRTGGRPSERQRPSSEVVERDAKRRGESGDCRERERPVAALGVTASARRSAPYRRCFATKAGRSPRGPCHGPPRCGPEGRRRRCHDHAGFGADGNRSDPPPSSAVPHPASRRGQERVLEPPPEHRQDDDSGQVKPNREQIDQRHATTLAAGFEDVCSRCCHDLGRPAADGATSHCRPSCRVCADAGGGRASPPHRRRRDIRSASRRLCKPSETNLVVNRP